MRILLLTKKYKNPHNRHLHFDFLMKLNGLCEVIPKQIVGYSGDGPSVTAEELYESYRPDIMMIHFHGRHLNGYFKKVPCAKVMVAVDSYKDGVRAWYKSNDFDLIVQRGTYNTDWFKGFPMVWLPFSADHKRFVPDPSVTRHDMVGFAGNWESPIYIWRRRALQKLEEAGLLIWPDGMLSPELYEKFLRTVVMGLTSTEISTPHAKVFEMMASGTIVLTSSFIGETELFGTEKCYVKYEETCADIVEKATEVLNDKDLTKEIAVNAYKVFIQKHTDSCRLHELHVHLRNLMSGKPVEKVWGL